MLDPTPQNCRALRERCGLSQAAIADMAGLGAAQRWAEYESGARRIDPARWELLLLKLGQHPDSMLTPRNP